MVPLAGAVANGIRRSSTGEVCRESGVEIPAEDKGNDFADVSFEAQENTGAASSLPQDTEMAGTKEEKSADEINVHAPATPVGSASEEFKDITIDFLELKSKSPRETLYRSDEVAYRAACGRTHALLAKKRKRPLRVSLNPDCLAMMEFGRGMKVQKRGILQRLEDEEARREYIKSELGVAIEKTESRARRAETASVAWNKWCLAKKSNFSHLDAVLANPSGRCSWGDFLQNGIRRSPTTPSFAGEHGGRSKYPGSTLHVGMPLSTGPMEELLDAQDSPTEEAKITLPSSQHQAVGDPTESSKGEDAPEQLSLVLDLGSTTLREASIPQDVGELQIVASDRREREETSGSPATVAKLHMALEHLTRHGGKGGAGGLSITECAQFCTEWPRDCQLPTFFDRVLLQAAWSADEQGSSGEGVGVGALHPAREALRHEAQRLFFAGFLGSSEGQGFVMHAIQDGTLAPEEEQTYVRDLTKGAYFDKDAQGFRRIIAHGDQWMHSRLIHEGVEQRVRVEIAEPVLRAMLDESTRHITENRGNLAAIVQYVYSLAASRLQPFLRGALARRRLPDVYCEFLSHAFFSAVVEIQRVWRGCIVRRRARKALVLSVSTSFMKLQAYVRGILLRRQVQKKRAALLERQAVEIQRLFRGYRSRGAVQTALREKTRAQHADLYGWASLVVQRQARAWLARRAVSLKKVQVGLTSRVSELADKLASSDDSRSVSAVFGQIDKDYRNYERAIEEMQAREENMATTFVEKVLERRDADIEGAWTRFVGAATEYCATLKCRSDALRAHPQPVSHDKRAGASATHDRKLLLLMERYGIQENAKTLPSAYLRAALPMHLKLRSGGIEQNISASGATQTKERQRISNKLTSSNERAPAQRQVRGAVASHVQSSISSGYAEAYFEDVIPSISSATAATTTTPPAGAGACAGACAGAGASDNSPNYSAPIGDAEISHAAGYFGKKQTANGGNTSIDGFENVGGVDNALDSVADDPSAGGHANSSAASSPGRCTAGFRPHDKGNGSAAGWESTGWESMWDAERESRGLTGDAGSRFPGSSARQDMPSGLKEGVERLCAAAFLRGHVPEGLMPKDTAPGEAYLRYLELPPSLAKIRHEQLCTQASRPVASSLRARGYTTLEQLLPPSKLQHLFSEAGAGVDETLAALSLAREMEPTPDTGGDAGPGRNLFSPLSSFARRGLAGSRRSPNSKDGSCRSRAWDGTSGGVSNERCRWDKTRSTSMGPSGGSGRLWTGEEVERPSEEKKKKCPPRISVKGLGVEGSAGRTGNGDGRWDPSRYTSQPEEWIKPPPSVIKRRWDDNAKAFVPFSQYSFDGLYRRHHPLDPGCDTDGPSLCFDDGRNIVSRGIGGDDTWHCESKCPPAPVAAPLSGPAAGGGGGDKFARRMEDILREEYGTFFDGMTQSAQDLYQYMINDSDSWGRVEDPIGTLLCRAAFFVVEHPSPATKAELAEAREKDLVAKGFWGKKNKLARPIALSGKFKPSGLEREVAEAALAGEQVPMGLKAFREFIRQLDETSASATSAGRPLSSTPKSSSADRPYGSVPMVPCRTLLERRLEAAATLADPFRLRLEADGIFNVKVLARVAVRAWELPPLLVEELERMLGLLIARTCASAHYHAHGGRSKNNRQGTVAQPTARSKECGFSTDNTYGDGEKTRCRHKKGDGAHKRQHLVDFDPRFQRSPIDPFGRPPRLDLIQPSLNPRLPMANERGNQIQDVEDDLPPGLWDRQVASEGPTVNSEADDNEVESTVTRGAAESATGILHPVEVERVAGKLPQELVGERKLQHEPLQRPQQLPQQVVTNKKSIGGKDRVIVPTSGKTPGWSSRVVCRERPCCTAAFASASTLRTHERSHATAPAYHRFRRAAQLLRDPPPARSEGAGAPIEKFRLRTTLPLSVRRELQSLQHNVRRRQSLLAGPGLSGTVATWAGVVSPGRTIGKTV